MHNTVKEPIQVVTLVGERAIDVLRAVKESEYVEVAQKTYGISISSSTPISIRGGQNKTLATNGSRCGEELSATQTVEFPPVAPPVTTVTSDARKMCTGYVSY